MKKIFYLAGMVLMSAAAMSLASCENDEKKPQKPNGGEDTDSSIVLDRPELVEQESTQSSVTLVWEAVENASSYAYKINDGDEENIGDVQTLTVSNLAAGQTWEIKVRAVAPAGSIYRNSPWATYQFYREPVLVDPDAALQKWLGTYTVTSEKTVVYNTAALGGDGSISYDETPQEFEISIQPSFYEDRVRIYGLSQVDETWYAHGAILVDQSTDGKIDTVGLALMLEETLFTSGGYEVAWLGICDTGGKLEFASGLDWAFCWSMNDDGTFGFEANKTKSTTGNDMTVVAADAFAYYGSGIDFGEYYDKGPIRYPSGTLTLVKTGELTE
ncbi:MAG TPA: fibronectin type III domain-containing protein [Candidatus Coprenecus pullistercoris]|nr:fibronectin type III domain-containing protein [Candidatus Coprenecus pullistercoris]